MMRRLPHPPSLALLVLLPLLGCPTTEPTTEPPIDPITEVDNIPGGNPLVPGEALYPFPSDLYLTDADTRTGYRVDLPAELTPDGLPPSIYQDVDGFSRATSMVTFLPGGIDPSTLPDPADEAAALADEANVWLIDTGSWQRVPVLVELDAHTEDDPDEQALIIRPHDTLDPATGYVVLLRDGLRQRDGSPHEPELAFRALRDELPTTVPEVEAQRESFELVHQAIESQGLARDEVIQAWAFHTASAESLHQPLLHMQQEVAALPLPPVTLESDEWDEDGIQRIVRGWFEAPDWIGEDSAFTRDDAGLPQQEGTRRVDFQITIPVEIEEPRPIIVYGHGFFSSPEEPSWGSLKRGLGRWQMSAATTEFIGFNEDDSIATIALIANDLAGLSQVAAQQLQSLTHFTLLARVVADLPEITLEDGATPVIDGDAVHYMGISNGGTQGLTLMATSPVLSRGALVVPGGAWSHMMQRAVQWNTLGGLLADRYDPLELQLVFAMVQTALDPADGANYAELLIEQRPAGYPELELTLHEAVWDSQVANYVTHWMARAAGVPLVVPAAIPVWGLEEMEAPPETGASGRTGLLIYDENYPDPPMGNQAPDEDNGAHATIRDLPAYYEQMGEFLETGRIIQVCDDDGCNPD